MYPPLGIELTDRKSKTLSGNGSKIDLNEEEKIYSVKQAKQRIQTTPKSVKVNA
jgi:hypothetical protein